MENKFEYLTEKQVAAMTQLALSTLRNYRHRGEGPAYVKAGRAVRYRVDDVVGYMERNRVTPKNL